MTNKFVRKTNMSDLVKCLGYIKCYSSSSPRPVKGTSNSIRQNCQNICCWLKRHKTLLEISKKAWFLKVINNPIIYKLLKDFTNHRKKNRVVVFSYRTFPNILKYRDHQPDFPTIWKTRLLQTLIEEFS